MRSEIDFQHYALYKVLGNFILTNGIEMGEGKIDILYFPTIVSTSYYIECKLEARRIVHISHVTFKLPLDPSAYVAF